MQPQPTSTPRERISFGFGTAIGEALEFAPTGMTPQELPELGWPQRDTPHRL
jgi:hypothetical protein